MAVDQTFHFHFIDYCVFGAMLILSAISGAYFGFCKKRKNLPVHPPPITFNGTNETKQQKTTKNGGNFGSISMNEYLLGSRNLRAFPVAMSLVASYISGVTILGTPSEIYNYGTQYWMIVVPIFLMGITVSTVYLPVFSSLKIGSSYEVRVNFLFP